MNTFILCFFLSGVVQLCLWLTASSFASVLVFAVVFGLVAPGYMGIIPQIIVQLFGPTNLATNVGCVFAVESYVLRPKLIQRVEYYCSLTVRVI